MKTTLSILFCLFSLFLKAQELDYNNIIFKSPDSLTKEERAYLDTITELTLFGLKEIPASFNEKILPNLLDVSMRIEWSEDLVAKMAKFKTLQKLNLTIQVKDSDLLRYKQQPNLDFSALTALKELTIKSYEITHITLGKTQSANLSSLSLHINNLASLKIDDEEQLNGTQLNFLQFKNLSALHIDVVNKIGITLDAAHVDNLTSLEISAYFRSKGYLQSFKINDKELLNADELDLPPFKKLTKLALRLEQITSLKLDALQFNQLLDLSLECYELKSFEIKSKEKIKSCPLSALRLYWSMSVEADLSFLKYCQDLASLTLIQIPAKLFPTDFSIFTKLKNLDLATSDLTVFPFGITKIRTLYNLEISAPITEIPESIADLEELSRLSIKSHKLTKIPSSIAACTQLKMLEICAPISELPLSLAKLNLKLLVIISQEMTKFPLVITQMQGRRISAVQIIAPISDFPDNIKISANILFLEGFQATQIPESVVFDCKDLTIYNSKLKNIPNSILENINELSIRGHEIPESRVEEIKKLMDKKEVTINPVYPAEWKEGMYDYYNNNHKM